MSRIAKTLTGLAWSAIGGNTNAVDSVSFVGASGGLPATYPVTDFASAAIATAALSVLELLERRNGKSQVATVDRRLSSLWFGLSIRPIGWELPPPWDPSRATIKPAMAGFDFTRMLRIIVRQPNESWAGAPIEMTWRKPWQLGAKPIWRRL